MTQLCELCKKPTEGEEYEGAKVYHMSCLMDSIPAERMYGYKRLQKSSDRPPRRSDGPTSL